MESEDLVYSSMPLEASQLDNLLLWFNANGGFNDLYIISGYVVYARVQGEVKNIIEAAMPTFNVVQIAKRLSRNVQIETQLFRGEPYDGNYEVHDPDPDKRGVTYRYRVNIKGSRARGGGKGLWITIREVNQVPPDVHTLGVEREIIDNFLPENGMVFVCGPTGSGKSTLFSAVLSHIATTKGKNLIIGTAEDPIENTFDHVDMKSVVIVQSQIAEIGGDINSYAKAVKASLRSGTDGMVIGEMRDLETIRVGLIAANTGQRIWATLHVNGVVDIPSRIINVFPTEEINLIKMTFYSVARFFLCQKLKPSIHPSRKRVAIKEWLKITDEMAAQLLMCATPSEEATLLKKFLHEKGMPMERYAKQKYDEGLISEEDYLSFKK